jgi:hypothetical protein
VDRPQSYAQQRRGDALGGQQGDSVGHRGRGDLIIAIGKRGAGGRAAPGQVEVRRLAVVLALGACLHGRPVASRLPQTRKSDCEQEASATSLRNARRRI